MNTPRSRERATPRAEGLPLTALLLALLIIIPAEASSIPTQVYAKQSSLLFQVPLLVLGEAPLYLWPGLLFLGGAALQARRELSPSTQLLGHLLLSAFVTLAAAQSLFYDPSFAEQAPSYILLAGLFVASWVALREPPTDRSAGLRLALWLLDRGLLVGALPAAIAIYVYAYVTNHGLYPSLQLTLLQIAHHLLGLGLWRLLRTRAPLIRPRPRTTLIALAVLASFTAAATLAIRQGALADALPYYRSFSILGQSHIVFDPFTSEDEGGLANRESMPAAQALEIFDRYTPMPELPGDFDLSEYNVLILATEATRFDQTSLADPELGTTPTLRQWEEDGAFVFTRAYSPSTGTLQSMSALLAMAYPSMIQLELWKRPWSGLLHPSEPLVQEHFRQAGFSTFWIGHNFMSYFTSKISGFARGWDELKLIDSVRKTVDNDVTIADEAIDHLQRLAQEDRRFFGWVFLESPHHPYHRHFPGQPRKKAIDRYRQEIRYADAQLARIYEALRANGQLDRTIIIYLSDHGEEFNEHGGTRHTHSVYGELNWVPLTLRIPGVTGARIDAPLSTLYVLPWLSRFGPPALSDPATRRIRRLFAPMLERTDGAVVSELLGHQRMQTSLVYPEHKLNYDLISERHEVFRILDDPLETDDLFGRDTALSTLARAQAAAYREVRRPRQRFTLRPDHK